MSLLDKYILRQAVIGLLFITAGLLAIVWLMQSARLLEIIISQGVSPAAFLRLTALGLPDFITLVTPAALAISTIFIFNRMGNDRELHIMAAAGQSPYQTARPIIWLSVAAAAVCYVLTLWLVPVSERQLRIAMFNIRHEITNLSLREKRFTKISSGLTIYARAREKDGSYRGIIISDTRTPGKRITIIAQQGVVMQQDSIPKIALRNGSQHETMQSGRFSILQFDDAIADLDAFFDKESSPISEFRSYSTLRMLTASEENFSRNAALKMRMNGHQRLVLPLIIPAFAFISCFGILKSRFNRRSNMPKVIKTAAMLLAVQMLLLFAQNLASRYYWGPIFMYLAVLLPGGLAWYALKKDRIYIAKWRIVAIVAAVTLALAAGKSAKAAQFNQGMPLDFSADAVSHNFKTRVITATGNVRVRGAAETMTADRIEYDINTEMLKAYGNVAITDDNGNVMRFGHAWLNRDLTQGYMRGLHMQLTDTTSIRAQGLARKDGTFNVLKGGAYTACVQDCDERAPLWQIRAAKMIYNQETERIYYQHARINVLGFPVFYTPYLSHPAPHVESQDGFLPPVLGSFNRVGTYIYLPYFTQISPYAQLTLSPLITFEQPGGGLGADFNSNYRDGAFWLTGLYAHDGIRDHRGFVNAETSWHATDTTSLHAQAQWVSDDTFLRTYSRPERNNPWLTSTLSGQYLTNDTYFSAGGYFYHDMRVSTSSDETPLILPLMQFSHTFDRLPDDSYFKFDSTGLALTRREGDRMQRLTTT
ncbi:MAG: LPS assembly protein LptD, partial [Alphaproteobacteria bacterium]|nr:LPS assembly protein LptD [Alphaproteobacteria bacterium]